MVHYFILDFFQTEQKKQSELKEAVDEKGKDVDNKTEEKMYLNNQLQNALEDAKVTKVKIKYNFSCLTLWCQLCNLFNQ